ncbi:M48 family metalloprotease [Aquabacterium sp.]|uniref:M48 family metalloprotease n=1 Tax=Aquabacterium sp. TaxID=1872578 RepID=UPI002E319F34|nr:M48 family metalloprotease [Aquabacterium sp.]HEX5310281.1 M48 family metalloprotease [Aquabacterium sp.]
MKFRQHQERAHSQTLRLFAWFALLLIALTGAINLLLALVYKLIMPLSQGYPALFFETNTAVVVLFVLGGAWVETQRLREGGGPRIAHWMGGREITDPDDALERRLINVVDEMALSSGQPLPRVYVLTKEDAINAFVAGWDAQDMVLCVTRGALERLNRAELQGLVAHEFGHIKEEDLPLCMRMLALVWGLSLIHGYGQTLMARDERGRVRAELWLIGLVFATLGWLGWFAGRLLQAAVSRQREYLADANAIQFTRSREGLGNVLRKIWHDQEVLTGRMRSPHAEMIAALLMYDGAYASWLATHPRLQDRIRRICGAVLPPLPAPLLRVEVVEPRRRAMTTSVASPFTAALHAAPRADSAAAIAQRAEQERQARLAQDQDACARLHRLTGPTEQRLAVLALMLDPHNSKERTLWMQLGQGLSHAPQILEDVLALLPQRRVPEFERLTSLIANRPLDEKRTLAETARDLLRVDGRVSPQDRLWWMALRHRMGVGPKAHPYPRPLSGGSGRELNALEPGELRDVAALTSYLARFIPEPETRDGPTAAGRAWFAAVMLRCAAPTEQRQLTTPPDADALAHALAGVQEMSWIVRPVLLRAWVEEALNHSPQGLMSHATADALRLTAGLIDSPLPPVLESHYQL